MATAYEMRQEFEEYMDRNGVKYLPFDEDDNIVLLSFGGDDEKDSVVLLDFDENDDCTSVHISSPKFAQYESANMAAVMVKVNEMNRRFRWVKFWISPDGEICAECDAVVYPGTVGPECVELAFRMSSIEDDAIDMLDGIATVNEDGLRMLRLIGLLKSNS